MKIKGEQKTILSAVIGGEDYDDVEVFWEYQPAEPDVNIQAGVEINTILGKGGIDLTDSASEKELDVIAENLMEEMYRLQDDDGGWEPPEPDEAQEWYDFDPDC